MGAAAVAGVAAGAGLVAGGVGSNDRELSLDAVPFASCPAAEPVGQFHRGDRVLATARDGSGDWLQLRDPRDLDSRVWVRAKYVVPDAATLRLPVSSCASGTALLTPAGGGAPVVLGGPLTAPGGAPVPTTIAPGPTTATTAAAAPSTAGTAPADTAPPSIGAASATPSTAYESPCAGQATTATVRVSVSDPSGIAAVTIAWQIGTRSGSAAASPSGGQYQASVGPFPNPTGVALPKAVAITITARDTHGNQATANASPLTLQACPI